MIQRPGADHHARWISEWIYSLHCQADPATATVTYPLVQKEAAGENDFHHLCLPEILIHFLFLCNAASASFELYKRIRQFSKLNKKLAEVEEAVLQRHTLYINEDLITSSLFNTK